MPACIVEWSPGTLITAPKAVVELSIINEEGVIVFSNIPQMKRGMYFSPLFPRFIELIKGKESKTIIETFDHDGKKWQFFAGRELFSRFLGISDHPPGRYIR